MKHPIWIALGLGLAVLVAAFVPPLWHMRTAAPGGAGPVVQGQGAGAVPRGGAGAADDDAQLPWAIEVDAATGRSQVFGLRLGQATLADAEARFADAMQLALVARLGEPGALEALVDPMQAGFVQGRLVLAFDTPEAARLAWRGRSPDSQPMEGGVRRFALTAADRAEARRAPLVGLSFVPAVRLSEADVRERFGAPAEVLALADGGQALLYPAKGLVAQVQPGVRGLLQYVAPSRFEALLAAPLRAQAGKPRPAAG